MVPEDTGWRCSLDLPSDYRLGGLRADEDALGMPTPPLPSPVHLHAWRAEPPAAPPGLSFSPSSPPLLPSNPHIPPHTQCLIVYTLCLL